MEAEVQKDVTISTILPLYEHRQSGWKRPPL